MDVSFLDQFPLPDGAHDALRKQGLQAVSVGKDVNRFMGHDKGVSFRFWIEQDYQPIESKKLKYEKFKDLEMIEWNADGYNKPTERVRFLPAELLEFDDDGEAVSGKYLDSYLRWKQGRTAPGLPLSKWGILADSYVATLAANGIFSVEQFSELPRAKVVGKYPDEIVEAFDRAILYVAAKENRFETERSVEEINALKEANARLLADMSEMKASIEKLTNKRSKASASVEQAEA